MFHFAFTLQKCEDDFTRIHDDDDDDDDGDNDDDYDDNDDDDDNYDDNNYDDDDETNSGLRRSPPSVRSATIATNRMVGTRTFRFIEFDSPKW